MKEEWIVLIFNLLICVNDDIVSAFCSFYPDKQRYLFSSPEETSRRKCDNYAINLSTYPSKFTFILKVEKGLNYFG